MKVELNSIDQRTTHMLSTVFSLKYSHGTIQSIPNHFISDTDGWDLADAA